MIHQKSRRTECTILSSLYSWMKFGVEEVFMKVIKRNTSRMFLLFFVVLLVTQTVFSQMIQVHAKTGYTPTYELYLDGTNESNSPNPLVQYQINFASGDSKKYNVHCADVSSAWEYVCTEYKDQKEESIAFELFDDWYPKKAIQVTNKTPISFYLNNHNIDRKLTAPVADGEVIYVNNGATLEISGPGKITGGYSSNGAGGIQIQEGNVRLWYGSICGNQSTGKGGAGIKLNSTKSYFKASGGDISNNEAVNANGGGIAIYNGYAEIEDCTIYNNTAINGGGIYLSTNQGGLALKVNTGFYTRITGNTAVNGGGIAIANGASDISGLIESNYASKCGGGIFVDDDHANYTKINGASIQYNKAGDGDGKGGGVYVTSHNDLSIVEANIQNNDAAYGGGVYAANSAGVLLGTDKKIIVKNNTKDNFYSLFSR